MAFYEDELLTDDILTMGIDEDEEDFNDFNEDDDSDDNFGDDLYEDSEY